MFFRCSVGREFGHRVGILFHNLVIHKTLNFSTPRKTDKIIYQKYCTQFLIYNFVDRFSVRSLRKEGNSSLLPTEPNEKHPVKDAFHLAPWVGIEPTTNSLTGNCSTAELPRNISSLCTHSDKVSIFPSLGNWQTFFAAYLPRNVPTIIQEIS